MANKKTAAEHKAERAKEINKSVEEEVEAVTKAAEKAREDAPSDVETEEAYRERIANVPGIFGDTDTTAGANASGVDVVSHNNELATQAVAEVEAAKEQGDDEAEGVSSDEARRQVDVAGGQPSAEEVEAGADDKSDDKDDKKTTRSSRNK